MDEIKYKEELKANGVELDELDEKTEPEAPEKEPKEPATDLEKKEEESKEKSEEKEPTLIEKKPEEPRRPRSIYQDLKDKKSEAKTEKERADKAERERDELQQKLDAVAQDTKDGKKPSAEDEKDIITYAEEINADPDLVRRIIKEARKGVVSPDYESLKKDIDQLKTQGQKTTQENEKLLEQKHFDEEFSGVLPQIKELFPSANEEEIKTIKKELDALSHQKDWHDKDLDYIIFKKKESLSALVTPKRRGMESREKQDVPDNTFEFDPNPDFSKMTPKQRDEWETQYRQAGKFDGLLQSKDGKKLIL